MNPKRKIIIISSISGIISLIFVFLVILPLINGIKKDSAEIISNNSSLKLLQDQENNIGNLKNRHAEVNPDFVRINNLFIDSAVPVGLIQFLENTAKDSRIKINIFRADFLKGAKNSWNYMNFSVNLTGSFSDFMKFIERIEYSSYFSQITSLSIREISQETPVQNNKSLTTPETISADLSIKIYTK